ncbi:MAG: DNA topoisomerase I [Chloroflexi bacterium RBG_13_51_52]|nr:MAG: DNA topoisomerase I [Chloroflexi bacterium RBG_13_51_52]
MSKKLVIVESPAKSRTLGKILGKGYSIKASLGHVRDLPKGQMGVDIENGFTPRYVVPKAKTKLVNELKQATKDATTIYLATDPDREGEAIAWHLAEVTGDKKKQYRRVVFREITEEAVKEAFQNPRDLNMQLVDAQQARRILDRLVGYKISPLLWKKVRKNLSAGRVQSVAVKIIVDREREIQAFVPEEYWVIEVELSKKQEKPSFRATLVGLVEGKKLDIHTQEESDAIRSTLEKAAYDVLKIAAKKVMRQPAPPFTTSTLQQEAWRKLRFTAKQTMAIAQQLYEGLPIGEEGNVGLITYMRTDSTNVAQSAIAEAVAYIRGTYGEKYLPPKPRVFTARAKGAQEAHEAIRPTRIRREPVKIKKYLSTTQYRLYDLVWKRMVASQMAAAVFDNTTVDIEAKNHRDYLLRTATSVNTFPGFITVYSEGRDEAEEEEKITLPKLSKGDTLDFIKVIPEQRFTQPPPRYTEATLVKTLEQYGIGRPSTYAPTISTIQDRDYVAKDKGVFQPTELGFATNDLLVQHFPDIINIKFTADMESELDDIASNERKWPSVIKDFYTPFEKDYQKAVETAEKVKLADEPTGDPCPKCGKPLVIKTGRFGKFVACSGYPECKYTQSFQVKVGAKCPECGKDLIQRINKKRRTFYGCSGYPECKFLTNFKPLPQPCPQCKSLLTEHGKQAWCIKCGYKGKVEEAENKSQ